MHTIDLSKYSIRTDLIIDEITTDCDYINTTEYNNIKLEELEINEDNKNKFNKKLGYYKTISFVLILDLI